MEATGTLDDVSIQTKTYKNLVPAYRQRIVDNQKIILKAEHEIRSYVRQINEMREFLKAH